MTVGTMRSTFESLDILKKQRLTHFQNIISKFFPKIFEESPKLMNPTTYRDFLAFNRYFTLIIEPDSQNIYRANFEFLQEFHHIIRALTTIHSLLRRNKRGFPSPLLSQYLDSLPQHFDHESVLIADPKFIIPQHLSDGYTQAGYGIDFESFGLTRYITRSTLYSDFDFKIFDSTTHTVLGQFTTDSGYVSIFPLTDVIHFVNPEIKQHTEQHPNQAIVLDDFSGDITVRVDFDFITFNFHIIIEGQSPTLNFTTLTHPSPTCHQHITNTLH